MRHALLGKDPLTGKSVRLKEGDSYSVEHFSTSELGRLRPASTTMSYAPEQVELHTALTACAPRCAARRSHASACGSCSRRAHRRHGTSQDASTQPLTLDQISPNPWTTEPSLIIQPHRHQLVLNRTTDRSRSRCGRGHLATLVTLGCLACAGLFVLIAWDGTHALPIQL